ncbi:hypothetical protein E2C01_007718 [Portunus trituberculatus]|uniref:Uncharacterized protein n=1 Tax=Portunus trituberculatus TaxID=210409 RepID=A0A5B7D0F3_PORTR|nr:hypothetical protein [Portunus trituberculatus]
MVVKDNTQAKRVTRKRRSGRVAVSPLRLCPISSLLYFLVFHDVVLVHSQPSLGTVNQLKCTNIATHRRLATLIIIEELGDDSVNI